MRSTCLWLMGTLVVSALAGCENSRDDGLVKHQVTGEVRVNGVPEKGIAVTFKHTDPSVTGNAARPVAVTGEDGRFTLSTNGDRDGAISGKYNVTFFWPQGGSSTRDFFDGKYVKTSGPEFEVEISDQAAEIPPFELEAPESAVQEAHEALAQKPVRN